MFCSLEEDVHVELEDVVHANIPYISMAIQAIHTYKAYLEFDIRFTHHYIDIYSKEFCSNGVLN